MQAFGRALTYITLATSLAACSTEGHNFQADRLSSLVPGHTTLAQAAYELSAPPTRRYPQSDGTMFVIWSYQLTLLTDGIYQRKDATLQFGADGRLLRLVDSTNISLKPWERQKLLGPLPLAE
jgi:hypothetical protein